MHVNILCTGFGESRFEGCNSLSVHVDAVYGMKALDLHRLFVTLGQ